MTQAKKSVSGFSPNSKKARTISAMSLTGKPICKLVPPGECQFTEEWSSCKLLERVEVSETSSLLRFDLPKKDEPLNLSTCACILAKADLKNREGEDEAVIRPYTPVSTNDLKGCFDLLVKNYGKDGRMSTHLCEMDVGSSVDFKHIPFNVKIQAPFKPKHIAMIVGGTGITPMIQALHAILGSEERSKYKVTMLYGSKVSSDILGDEILSQWARDYPELFTHKNILSHEPDNSEWTGNRGYISLDLVKEDLPSASMGDDVIVFVCGPPPMMKAICGPREEKKVTGILSEAGYIDSQVFKF